MIQFVTVEEARTMPGLRVVMVGTVPSPWGEAAKGVLHVNNVAYVAARMGAEMPAVQEWTGHDSAPIAVYEDETPRTGWVEILLLAQRLAERPVLLPEDAADRALVLGLSHEICGEDGLGWARRIQGIHAAMTGEGGFPRPVADYLAPKYGYRTETGEASGRRVIELLRMFSQRLQEQRATQSHYLVGNSLTAADIYLATFLALFAPLPDEHCPMPPAFRAAFESMDEETSEALDPILLEHRDEIYEKHLELPLTL